ncbi:MAG: hypothetical protein MPJ50_02130 [Pirellulales bacterium]|nr:hypothetical protein [Pirellulales bacterium]
MTELLKVFATERGENLQALDDLALTTDQLQLEGEHPALGTVSLGQLLAAWTAHDLNHIAQVC